ncbi:MAG: glycosyltransferase family 4 protein [Planctomycetota bacterium]
MRVVQVVPGFGIGGTEKAGCVLAEGLGAAGHEAHVVGRAPGPRFLEAPAHGVRHHLIEEADDGRYASAIHDLAPDVIHLHGGDYNEPLISALASVSTVRGSSATVVVTPVFGRPPASRETLSKCHTCLIGVYMLYRQRLWMGMTAEQAMRHGVGVVRINSFERTDPPQSTLDPVEVAHARRRELGVPEDAFVVGRIGRDTPGKWSAASEQIVNRALESSEKVVWLSIGYPAEKRGRDRLEARWGERFVNHPQTADFLMLAKVFAAMDVQLFFSLFGECFSTTICEAAGGGLPTIAGANPLRDNGQSEQIIDGLNGYLVSSPEQAFERVSELVNAPDKLQAMKQATHDYAHARWTTPTITRDLVAFYEACKMHDPLASPYSQRILAEEAEFAAGYRPRMLKLLAEGPFERLKWNAKLRAVANWNLHRLAVQLKRLSSGRR